MKTLLAMPYVIDPDGGRVVVITGGVRHEIVCKADQVSQSPIITDVTSNSQPTVGTSIRVQWIEQIDHDDDVVWPFDGVYPELDRDCREDGGIYANFLRLVSGYAFFNPHLTLKFVWFGATILDVTATDPEWKKWKPNRPTSPHWYEQAHVERIIAAYVHHDRENDTDRTVAAFLAEFNGLTRSATRKAVMEEAGLSRVKLSSLDVGGALDHEAIENLLAAMKCHTKPVKASQLGVIGRQHMTTRLEELGGDPDRIEYKAVRIEGAVPVVIEVAFAWLGEYSTKSRQLFTGINWSSAIKSPFRSFGCVQGLEGALEERWVGWDEPVMFLVHMAHPRPNFVNRGKTEVAVDHIQEFNKAIDATTKKWTAQRKREEKNEEARERRESVMMSQAMKKPMTMVAAADEVIPEAYLIASNDGAHYAKNRQIFYKARKLIQELLGDEMTQAQGKYFTSTLLPNYLSRHSETNGWLVAADARGNVIEPHTGKVVPVGTIEINDYLAEIRSFKVTSPGFKKFCTDYPTCGPKNRSSGFLFIEKEGFHPLFKQVQLAKRFDLTLLSTKGHSVIAGRHLVDELCAIQKAAGVPLFILHDFDASGMLIAEGLTRVSQAARDGDRVRYEFRNKVEWYDLGLRLEDVEAWELDDEPCKKMKEFNRDTIATPEEQAFLAKGRRVELNAFTSGDLIRFIETKLRQHGVKRLVPDDKTLEDAWRRAFQVARVNRRLGPLFTEAKKEADAVQIPGMAASALTDGPSALEDVVRRRQATDPAIPWDEAISEHVKTYLDQLVEGESG